MMEYHRINCTLHYYDKHLIDNNNIPGLIVHCIIMTNNLWITTTRKKKKIKTEDEEKIPHTKLFHIVIYIHCSCTGNHTETS